MLSILCNFAVCCPDRQRRKNYWASTLCHAGLAWACDIRVRIWCQSIVFLTCFLCLLVPVQAQQPNLIQNSALNPIDSSLPGCNQPIWGAWILFAPPHPICGQISALSASSWVYPGTGWFGSIAPIGPGIAFNYSTPAGGNPVPVEGQPGIYQEVSGLLPGASYILSFWQGSYLDYTLYGYMTPQWGVSLTQNIIPTSQFKVPAVVPTSGSPFIGISSYHQGSISQSTMVLSAPSSTAYLQFRGYFSDMIAGDTGFMVLSDIELRLV